MTTGLTCSIKAPPVSGRRGAYAKLKRPFDLGLAVLLLIPALPVMLAACGLIRLTSKGPAFYRQLRIGKDEKPFTLLKLRTMQLDSDDRAQRHRNRLELLDLAEPDGGIFKVDHPYVTRVGRILRRFSIDELPQLFNVLWGDMSIVGPRPSLPWEVEMYTPEQRRRHECRPGLTGLWQVSGRNRLSMSQMLELDLQYLRLQSPLMDAWILLRTPAAVISGAHAR